MISPLGVLRSGKFLQHCNKASSESSVLLPAYRPVAELKVKCRQEAEF